MAKENLPPCPLCGGDMHRETTAFIKCNDKQCSKSLYGIRHNHSVKPVRGVDHLLSKKV